MEEKNVAIPEVGCAHDAPALFENAGGGWKVRVIDQNGEPWFYASDVASALGYSRPADAVNAHCKKACKISQYCKSPNRPPVSVNIIPESDVYRLVMRSNLPDAERFQDWVCEDVLPSIRKHGMYATPDTVEKMLNDPDVMIGLLQGLKAERARAELAEKQAALAIEERDVQTARADAEAARAEQEKARAHKAYGGKGGLRASLNRQKRRTEVAEARVAEAEADRDAACVLADDLLREKRDSEAGLVRNIKVLKDKSIFCPCKELNKAAGRELVDYSHEHGLEVVEWTDPEYGHTMNKYRPEAIDWLVDRIRGDKSFLAQWRVRPRRMALLDLTRTPVSSSTIQ